MKIIKNQNDMKPFIQKTNTTMKVSHDLYRAIQTLNFEVVRGWLSLAPDAVHEHTADATTPLYSAIVTGNVEMLDLLLDFGADPNLRRPNDSITALHFACLQGTSPIIAQLVKRGANMEERDDVGMTPLFHAARRRGSDCIKMLISLGADLNVLAKNGQSVLDHAKLFVVGTKRTEVVEYLEAVLLAQKEKEELGIIVKETLEKTISQSDQGLDTSIKKESLRI